MPGILIPLAFLALFWVLYVLPQQRRIQAHRRFVAGLEVGDEVVTTAGIYGTVTAVEGDDVRLLIAPGVEIRLARLAVGHSAVEPEPEATPPAQLDDIRSAADDD
jgi:preprotein translocase subunit YajC